MRWLLCLWCLTASAAELSPDQAFNAYVIAFGNAGYIPPRAPTINLTSRRVICQIAGLPDKCPVKAVLGPDGVITLDATLDFADPHDASILIHEMVHYVDWSKSGPATNCAEWLRREQRAYTIQGHALEKIGADPSQVYLSLRAIQCQEPKQ